MALLKVNYTPILKNLLYSAVNNESQIEMAKNTVVYVKIDIHYFS